ncbi:MAG TPA: ABC transporter permease [Thermoanaerobaculia bacterium]|nr:ABC transporter permease [Thermoanaerobaculia bacterium]
MAIFQDIKFAFRSMRKNPGFTAIVVLTLAFGIGSNATVYSGARVFLLAPLPGLREPDRLMRLVEIPPQRSDESGAASPGNLLEWRRQASYFASIAACDETLLNVTGSAEPERIVALRGTASYFRVLGFTPLLGRGFLPDEDQPGRDAVAVLSHGFWNRRYAGDRNVIGRTISLDGRSVTIIGVMPPNVSFPEISQVWVPLALGPSNATDFAVRSLLVFGRLKPGFSVTDAQAQLSAIAADVARAHPGTNAGWGARIWPLVAYQARDRRPFILLLAAAAGLVLVIVCANVANLLLARASARQREFSLRSALGASQLRVFRQCLTESLLLGLFGGALGALVAYGELALVRGAVPGEITQFLPAWHSLTVDNQVLAYTALLTFLVGLIFGAAPALNASRVSLQESLKEGGWGSSTGGRGGRLRQLLVISETALALMLLASTGLMVKSFASILKTDPGFRTDHLLTMDVTLSPSRYPDILATSGFYAELSRSVRALPGVRAMALITGLPLSPWDEVREVEVVGRPANASEKPSVGYRVISDEYLATMEIPLLRGRAFDGRDHDQPQSAARGVAIINEATAKVLWPGADPLGQRIRVAGEAGGREREIVGLVRNIRSRNMINKPPRSEVYVPLHQALAPIMALVVRTADDPASHTGEVQRQIAALDPTLAGGNVQVFDRVLVRVMSAFRVTTGMLVVFALLALLLAGLGIYGVISFATVRRTKEIGIRVALGAERSNVLSLIIRQGMRLSLIGLAIGLAGALALTRAMAGILVGVSPTDLVTLSAACALLAAVALLASYLPARYAARLNPLAALRSE